MVIKIADIVIDLNVYDHLYLGDQLLLFQTHEKPEYTITTSCVDSIEIPSFEPISKTKQIVNYQTNQGSISLGYVNNELCYQVLIDQKHKNYRLELLKESHQKKDELEFVILNRIFASIAISHQLLTLHASAINFEGEAILFSGHSGVGKTTLAKKWIKHQPEAFFINDDKPLIGLDEETVYVYGSPFAGQESLSSNSKTKLKAIVFLKQSDHHELIEISNHEKIVLLMEHIHRFITVENINLATKLIGDIIDLIPIYIYALKDDEKAYHHLYQMLYK